MRWPVIPPVFILPLVKLFRRVYESESVGLSYKKIMMSGAFITGTLIAMAFAAVGTVSGVKRPPGGEMLYRTHCGKCHGVDGSKGKAGKNNLQLSVKSEEAIRQQISEGKKGMPAFKKKLSAGDIAAISDYVITLRK